nr:hypothetical protein [Tanacetum cinerariifolium]
MLLPLCHVYLFIFYVIPCLYIPSLSVMLSRISFHVLYGRYLETDLDKRESDWDAATLRPPFRYTLILMDIMVFFTKRVVTESMPNHDSSITISSKIDFLFDEFDDELTLLKSFPSGINETDCHPEKEIHLTKRLLYDNSSPHPPKEIISDNSNADIESFSPSPIPNKDSDPHMEEIDLYFTPDDPMPLGIEEDGDDSKRDISILEKLLDNYSLSLPTNESYHFDIPSPYRPPAKPPYGNTGTLNVKMVGDVSDQKVPIPNLTITQIDLYFTPDDPMPPGIEEDGDDSERDIPILEKLLDNYSLSLPTNESYHFDIPLPYRPPAKPPYGNTGTLNVKMVGDVSDQKVPTPNLTITRIFNQEKSPDLLSHLGFKAFQPSAECPMIINGKNTPVLDVPLFHFYPLDQFKYGRD